MRVHSPGGWPLTLMDDVLRILHVVPSYLPALRYGGPIQSVHGLCKALALRGHEVHVFTTNLDGDGWSDVPLECPVNRDGVQVWYFPTARGRRLYRSPAMAKALFLKVRDFSIVHLHSVFLWPTTVAARVARKEQIPYVLSPRGMLVGDLIRRKSHFAKTIWINLFEKANIAGAASMHMTAELELLEFKKLGLRTKQVAVVPNGIDLPEDDAVRNTGGAQAEHVVLSLGRISWKKGLDRLIRAMALVPNAELVIAGNDEEGYQPKLETCAKQFGVAGRVKFVGPVYEEGKWKLLRSADVFVMPSYSENFGIAALEAMASGLPVVVTPEVGLAQSINAAGAGVVAAGNPVALGSTIAALLGDVDMRARMGNAGKMLAQNFSWASVAGQMEAIYVECIQTQTFRETTDGD